MWTKRRLRMKLVVEFVVGFAAEFGIDVVGKNEKDWGWWVET